MKHYIGFATAGSIMTMIFLAISNYLTTPDTIWFIYPCLLLLLWPTTMYVVIRKTYKSYSVFCSLMFISLLVFENYKDSPDVPWFLYAVYPIIWWPVFMYLGRKAALMRVALIGSLCTIIYYVLLNIILSPQYPWALYPAFLVIWWPLSLYHGKKKTFVSFSIQAAILISIFFIVVNAVSSPNTIWAIYPIFGVLWWPLSMYFYVYRRRNC